MAYRSSTGDLGFHDEPRRPRPAERWDREKFERYRSRGPEERESFRFEERDHYGGRRDHVDYDFEERFDRRRPTAVMERERFAEHDRFSRPSRRRTDFFEEPPRPETTNQALMPYRRKSIIEREVDVDVPARRPARPQYIRRQSSLDTFDRRPLPRYGDKDRDEWRPPVNTPIPLPIRDRPSRRISPPRDTYDRDVDYEASYRYRDTEPDPREEDYRDVHIRRERSVKRHDSRPASSSRRTVRSERSSSESFEEVSPPPVPQIGKKGKTRMPKRLVHHKAITELGVSYEEDGEFYVVQRALEKDHIDEIIKNSDKYKEVRTTYKYEDTKVVEAPAPPAPAPPPPPPPAPEPVLAAPPPPPPPPMSVASHHSHRTHHTHHSHHTAHHAPSHHSVSHHSPSRAPTVVSLSTIRSNSPPRHTVIEERIEESNPVGGPLTIVRTDRPVRSDREIKEEIRALESEREILRVERDGEYEFIERRPREREVLRVEKDRKGSDARILAAMVSTLT